MNYYPQQYGQPYTPPQMPPKKKRSPFLTAMIIALSVTLTVESAIACFWLPGFFTGGRGGGEGQPMTNEMIEQLANEPLEDIDPSELFTPVKVSEIVNSYTEAELSAAPVTEMKISPDAPKAAAGKFSVEFNDCEIFTEDTFIVKELPVHENKDAKYTLTGYDFSLASGKDEFFNEVVVSVPRDAEKDVNVRFISKNKETGKYERDYFEVSKDGSSYLIYTDHFSEHDKLTYYDFTEGMALEIIENGAKSQAAIDTLGTFYYPKVYSARKRMTSKVDWDRDFMWNVVAPRYTKLPDGIDLLPEIAKQIKSTPQDKLQYSAPLTAVMWANGVVDYTNSSLTVAEASLEAIIRKLCLKGMSDQAKAAAEGAAKAGGFSVSRLVGGIATLVSYFLTVDKICSDEQQGKYASWIDAYKKNWLAILGIGVGVVGTVVGTGGVALGAAVAGMVLFGCAVANEAMSPRELSQVEQVYRDYYMTPSGKSRVRIFYGDEQYRDKLSEGKGYMKPLTSIDPNINVLFAYNINNKLAEYGVDPGIPGDDPMKNKETDKIWRYAVSGLFHLINKYEEEPDYEKIFKEFYHNYAEACFNMSKDTYLSFARSDLAERGWDPAAAMLPEDAYPQDAAQIREDYINNMVNELLGKHKKLFWENVIYNMHRAQVEAEQIFDEMLIPLMNIQMEFRVVDNSLSDPNDFSQSAFNVPGRLNKDVDLYRSSYYGYADLSKCVDYPMYFAVKDDSGAYKYVGKPVFMPRQSSGGKIVPAQYTDYYPARGNFVPKWSGKKGDNLVFRCTFFHYMMMGSPTVMCFRDMNDLGKNDKIAEMKFMEPDDNGVAQVLIEAPRLNQPDSADMKIISDNTMNYCVIEDIPEYVSNPMPANCSVSIGDDGKTVDIILPSVDHSFNSHPQSEEYNITYTYTHKRNALNMKGRIIAEDYSVSGNLICKKGVIQYISDSVSGSSLDASTRTRKEGGGKFDYFSKQEILSKSVTFADENYNNDPTDDNVSWFIIHYSDDPKKKDHIERIIIYLKGEFSRAITDHREPDTPHITSEKERRIELVRVD